MFCCAVSLSGRPLATDAEAVTAQLRRHHPGDAAGSEHAADHFATQTLMHSTPESRREQVPARDAAGRILVSWLRLDNRDELGRKLGWDPPRTGVATDPDLVLAAYSHWGPDCPDHLEGDFAFVVHEPGRRSMFGARDASGIRPLYYAATPRVFAAATSPALLTALAPDGIDVSVRPEWVARFLHGQSMTWDETPFVGIAKLPPGHAVQVDDEGVRVSRWHEYRDDPPWEESRADHWLSDYRDRLHEAVRCRIRSDGPLGVETSGGIDSSTILALVANLAPERLADLHGFAFVQAELEPEYILETSRVLRVPQTHVFTGFGERHSEGWEALGHPVEHSNATGHLPFYELAATLGVRTLHSGHGGDEFVTNPAGMVLHELADRGAVGALLRDLPHPAYKRPAWIARETWRRLRGTRPPEVSQLTAPMMQRLAWTPLRDQAFADAGIAELTRATAQQYAGHRTVNGFALEGRCLPFVSTRTAECSVVAAAHGVDYRWPLLDRRLVQQWLSTPAVWKYAEGTGRYLHRRAISDVVPAKVAWKESKQMNLVQPTPPTARAHEATPLHPLLAEIIDPERWRHPASRVDGRAPVSVWDSRAWDNATQVNAWLSRHR